MRISYKMYILLIKSDLKWCIHLSRSLFLYSKSFKKKQRRVELKSVGNFVAKTVLVENANKFYRKSCVGYSAACSFEAISSIRASEKKNS